MKNKILLLIMLLLIPFNFTYAKKTTILLGHASCDKSGWIDASGKAHFTLNLSPGTNDGYSNGYANGYSPEQLKAPTVSQSSCATKYGGFRGKNAGKECTACKGFYTGYAGENTNGVNMELIDNDFILDNGTEIITHSLIKSQTPAIIEHYGLDSNASFDNEMLTLTYSIKRISNCNNAWWQNHYLIDLYVTIDEPCNLTIESSGPGSVELTNTNTTIENSSYTLNDAFESSYNLKLNPLDGARPVIVIDGEVVDAHADLDQYDPITKPDFTTNYITWMNGTSKTVTVRFEEYTITPEVDITDLKNTSKKGNEIYDKQIVMVKDNSTVTDPRPETITKYGDNPRRVWRIWDNNPGEWKTLTRKDIYNNLIQATSHGISLNEIDINSYNSTDKLTDESFPYFIYAEEFKEFAFQIVHSNRYDNEIIDPSTGWDYNTYAEAAVFYNGFIEDEDRIPFPTPLSADFKILYKKSDNNIKDVTDRNSDGWYNESDKLTVSLSPTALSNPNFDGTKVEWNCRTEGVTIETSSDGIATAEIPGDTIINFEMRYPFCFPVTHWTKYIDTGTPLPQSTSTSFTIEHNGIDVTNESFEAPSQPQTIKLNPTNLALDSYAWYVKNPATNIWTATPFSTEKTPTYSINYNTNYEFKLIAGTSEIINYTKMTPPPSPVKVNVTISSPAEFDIHDVPTTEYYGAVKVTPIQINLKASSSDPTVTLDNNWEWKVWLTGLNDSDDPDGFKTYLLTQLDYETTSSILDPITSNPTTYCFDYNPSNPEPTLSVPYWCTDREVGRRILFTAYAELVRKDGTRKSNCALNYTFTLLVDNTPSPSPGFKEYITSIDNLQTELDSTTNLPVYEAGATIEFTADISQTSQISVAHPNILTQSTYSNSGTSTKFETDFQLTNTGEYDPGKDYNMLTITANHLNGIHSAKQKFKIRPNWYIGTHSYTEGSALKIISVRDLRWQSLYNTPSSNPSIKKTFALSSGFGDKNLLTPVYRSFSDGSYSNSLRTNDANISNLKVGYAVQFELKVTDTFAKHLKDNGKITIKTNATALGITWPQANEYSEIILSKNTANDANNKFLVKHSSDYKTWTFIYYLPPTIAKQSGTKTIKFTSIIADNGKGSSFDWLALAKKEYGWNGKIFNYDLSKSVLDDTGNNSN